MWRLLRKGLELHKSLRNTPFKRIVYCCALVHIFFLFGACFVQTDDHLQVMVQGTSDARIVCLPSFMLPPQRTRTRNKKKKQRTPPRVQKKKKQKTIKQKPEQAALRKKAKSTIQEPENNLPKKQKQVQKKIIEQEIETQEEIVEDEITPVESAVKQVPEQLAELPDAEFDIIYVNRETYEMLEVGKALQEAIGLHWAPPAGMPAQTKCLIRVTLDRQGKPTAIDVVEKSGVAVFDMAARSAVRAAEYPQSVWGKTMVVHFNEEFA